MTSNGRPYGQASSYRHSVHQAGSASPSRSLCAWRGSCRAPPSARQAAPALGKGCRCAAVFDGLRPGGLGRSGGGFRFGSCLSENDRPSRPIPCGPFSARPSSAPHVAPRGTPGSSVHDCGGLRGKSEGCRTPDSAHRTPRTRSPSTAPCLTAIPWWEPTLSAIPRQRALLRQAPIADRVGSHQSDGHPNGGCCLCHTTPQCAESRRPPPSTRGVEPRSAGREGP